MTPSTSATPISPTEWNALRALAIEAMGKAYARYSGFPVGAAALADDGRRVSGCNVENASYGLTLCAECSLVSALMMSGGGRLVAFICVDGNGDLLVPCGRCRQLLLEHGGLDLVLLTPDGEQTMAQMLPQSFGPHTMDAYRQARDAGAE